MIKTFTLLLTLVSGFIFAQNSRFIYQVSMKIDSLAAPTVENAYLDVAGNKSVFYGEKRMKRDSVMRRNAETKNFSFDRSQMQQYRSEINYQIEKDLTAQKITFKNRIMRDQYTYDEDRPFSWKILPETTKIGDYRVQKAETDFAGRNWTAWFTQDVPIMDGPYKFSGLPGLIVKIEDSKGHYSFDLIEAQKINELPDFQLRGGNVISVKRKDYDKQMEKYITDPVSFINSQGIGFGGSASSSATSEGRRSTIRIQMDPQRKKEMENRLKEEAKKNNNPIEKAETK